MSEALALQSDGAGAAREAREKILRLEAAMLAMPEHQVEIKTTHYFAPGLYMREIFVPKGTLLTGKIQKTEYLNILSAGDISVMTEAGLKRTKAPAVLRSKPGLKRAGVAHEDTVWLTVHQNPTDERDIEKLEEILFADSFDEVPPVMSTEDEAPVITYQGKTREKEYLKSGRDLSDVMLALGVTPEQMQAESENFEDQIFFPLEEIGIRVGESTVHGKGVFAIRRFDKNESIAPARIAGKRAPAGRYTNHGARPNAVMVMLENGDVDLVALEEIEAGTEILIDYYFAYMNTRGGR